MNKIYHQTLLAGAMSAFIITPALSDTAIPTTNVPTTSESTLVAEAPTERDRQMPDNQASEPVENELVQPDQVRQERLMNESMHSELHSMRPEDLVGEEVRNSNEESIGKISEIVSSRQDGQIHAVISSGGFLGMGATEYVVPLNGLSMNEEKLYLRSASGKDLVRKEYLKDGFVVIKPKDRPISEFSAFEERKTGERQQ